MNGIDKLKSDFGGRILSEVPLSPFTTMKIGGPAEYFIEAANSRDLKNIIIAARRAGVAPVTVLGGGTNVIIADSGIAGLVIRNTAGDIRLKGIRSQKAAADTRTLVFVEADSGVLINKLVRFTADEGLQGLEMHLGLPGTVGGAVFMNSKWTKPTGYVGDAVFQAEILTAAGVTETVTRDYFRFKYDYSRLQETGDTLLSVVFSLVKSDPESVWKVANESIHYRRGSQPQGVKSAGCAFQNISESQAIVSQTPGRTRSAGYLLDHAGMKGVSVGGAKVSDSHANFIVNTGSATAGDVLQLTGMMKSAVRDRFGIVLEPEIRFLGGR